MITTYLRPARLFVLVWALVLLPRVGRAAESDPQVLAPAPRPHLDAETQATYDRIRGLRGWMLGVGSLGTQKDAFVDSGDAAGNLKRWETLYGPRPPACYEWDLGEQAWMWRSQPAYRRDWAAARAFSDAGGLPWFRLTLRNFSVPMGPNRAGSANDVTGRIAPVLPGGDHHQELVAYFTQLAREVKTFGRPCVFRPFHEMNGGWFWWGARPEAYRQLWKLAFDVFRREGVKNTLWCWATSGDSGDPRPYYPGDDVVDLVGTDQYFDGPALPARVRQNLALLSEAMPEKPLVLAELGPVARADFWSGAAAEMREIPRLRMVMVWFARGWNVWGSRPGRGSLIDETSPAEVRAAFAGFLADRSTFTRERLPGR